MGKYGPRGKTPAERNAYHAAWKADHQDRVRAHAVAHIRRHPERRLWASARARALKSGRAFTIVETDVVIPAVCPVLGIPLTVHAGYRNDNSPSLDRIDSTLGYEPGNVAVISWRANRLKSAMSLEEVESLARYMRGKIAR